MSLFSGFISLFRRSQATPPKIGENFAPIGLATPDADELCVRLPEYDARQEARATIVLPEPVAPPIGYARIEEDIYGTTLAIEYRSASDVLSRRRITLKQMYRGDEGIVYLQCYCHERRAPRLFRFDRVIAVFDSDGEIHEPERFFERELGVIIAKVAMKPAADSTPKTSQKVQRRQPANVALETVAGKAQRAAARDGLRVLVALSRSDGEMHPAEELVIMEYIVARAARSGVDTGVEDRAALAGYIRRQRPGLDVLAVCLERLGDEPEMEQLALFNAAKAVMQADGAVHPSEADMLRQMGVSLKIGDMEF